MVKGWNALSRQASLFTLRQIRAWRGSRLGVNRSMDHLPAVSLICAS